MHLGPRTIPRATTAIQDKGTTQTFLVEIKEKINKILHKILVVTSTLREEV